MHVARSAATLLGAAALVGLSACSRTLADPRLEAPLVRVAVAAPAGPASQTFTGVVSAKVQSDLGFRVGGKVVERLVDAGQTVRRGQPLMRIDRVDYALALDAAQARASQTAADEARYRDLVDAGAVSAAAYDQVRAAAETARAQMRVAQNEASYSVLVADADGIVVETLAEPGQVVAAGQTVVRLARAGPREARVDLPETLRPPIGSQARASLFGRPDGGTARLRQLSDAADPQTRTFDARFVLDGAAAHAPLGATVTISLSDAGAPPAVEVPIAAIIDKGQGPGVWIVGGAEPAVTWRPVRLARISDEAATVTSGLSRGERFVALGAQLLHAGERVRIAPATVAAR